MGMTATVSTMLDTISHSSLAFPSRARRAERALCAINQYGSLCIEVLGQQVRPLSMGH